MFNVGDKVVCVKEPESNKYLSYGSIYTVSSYKKTNQMSFGIITFYEIADASFSDHRFKSAVVFRKEKIEKIKERICSKRVI